MAVDQTAQSESARLTASKDPYVARGVATSPPLVVSDEDLQAGLDPLDGCLSEA